MSAPMKYVGALVLFAVAVFLASLTQLSDWDTFYHLAYGRDVLRRGGFSSEDPFLYPLAGHASGAQGSWLGSVVIYLSWRVGGDPGPVYLAGLMGAVLFVTLLKDGLDDDRTLAGMVMVLVPLSFALAVFRERAVARPELFANILLAWTLIGLRRYAVGKKPLLLIFPILAALWANLHHSVLVGIALPGMFLVVNGALLYGRRLGSPLQSEVPGPQALVTPALVTIGAFLAVALLNPSGISPLLTPVDFVLSIFNRSVGVVTVPVSDPAGLLSRMVDELRSPTSSQWLGPFGWLVGLCMLSFPLVWARGNLRELVICVIFVYLAASAQRFMVLAAIVMAPITARNLRLGLASSVVAQLRAVRWSIMAVGLVGMSFAAWTMWHISGIRFGTGLARQMPVRAVQYLKSIGFSGRLFNTFHFGGFLEWMLDTKVFQDGRGLLLPEDARAAYAGPSAYRQFETLDRRYHFDALVIHYPQFTGVAFSNLAVSLPGTDWGADRRKWALVAFDDGGQVYLRRDGAYAAFVARDEYRYAMPTNSLAVPQAGDAAHLRQDLERSLREVPDCLRCRTMLGFLLNDMGKPEEAMAMLAPATDGLPETRLYALMGLARAAEARSDLLAAAARWRDIIALAPDPSWSRRQLAEVLLRSGRLNDAWSTIRKNLGSAAEQRDDLLLAVRIAQARRDGAAVWQLSKRLGTRGR